MGFLRAIFLFALVMLIIGIVGTHYLLANLFGPPVSVPSLATAIHRPTSTPRHRTAPAATATPTNTPTHPTPAKTAIPSPTTLASPIPVPTVHVAVAHRAVRRHRAKVVRRAVATAVKPKATPLASPTPTPTPTPTTGIVTLTSYWVGNSTAQPGQTVSIGYVIDNGTGHTARIMLGASIKSSHVISWLSGQINDPYHDVVAVVPPGVSTHVRYFTLPSRLHAGTYDVAWGLRNALSGGREALIAAPDALHVSR